MRGINLDPRTKLLLLVLCVLCTMFAPSLTYELILVGLVGAVGVLSGKYRYAIMGVAAYGIIYGITQFTIYELSGTWQAILAAFFGLVNKVYPCGFLAGFMVSTTKTGEFMAALQRIHMPNQIVIPFAVMLRYLPVVREDWHYIKDAMRMRDIAPTVKNVLFHPVMTVECLYVPLRRQRPTPQMSCLLHPLLVESKIRGQEAVLWKFVFLQKMLWRFWYFSDILRQPY